MAGGAENQGNGRRPPHQRGGAEGAGRRIPPGCWWPPSPAPTSRASRRPSASSSTALALARAAGLLVGRDGDVRLLAEEAALRAHCATDAGKDAEALADATWARHRAARRARPAHGRRRTRRRREEVINRQQRGDARAVDAGGEAVGRHPRAADDRHARQRAHAGGHGDRCCRRIVETGARDRDHRHHRRADRRHAGRAAPAQDGDGASA